MNIKPLVYPDNSADLFDAFADLPYAIWLDSCELQGDNARFDIMSASPDEIINVKDESTPGDPFQAIQNALDTLPPYPKDNPLLDELPFQYGAIGYLSYDLGRRWHPLPSAAKDDIRWPHALVGIYTWSIIVDHLKKKAYFITAFDSSDPRYNYILEQLEAKRKSTTPFRLTKAFESNMSKTYYTKAFERLQQHIRQGDCYQANLCQRFSAGFDGSPWHAYQELRTQNPTPFAAYFNTPNGAVLSLSPERFIKIHNGDVETKPIKGTSARYTDPEQDKASAKWLLNSEKDKAENLMIVDLLRNDLGKSCVPGSIKVPHLFALESFPNVHHLVSTITGTLRAQQSALDLLRNAFPGGSITGAPKLSAMKIIETLEPHRRALYCGSLFYVNRNGNLDTSITIRTLICDDDQIHCYAGGGIVADSECESEYEESLVKIRKLIRTLESCG